MRTKDNRQEMRISQIKPIGLKLITKKGYRPLEGAYLLNVSAGGAKVVSLKQYPPSALVELDLSLKDEFVLSHVLGEVVWQSQKEGLYEIGIRFIALTYEQEKRLRSHCYREQVNRYKANRASLAHSLSRQLAQPSRLSQDDSEAHF